MKTAFVDSSVLFTAVNSPSGGSAKLFTLKHIQLLTTNFVLTEVERNVRSKLQTYHLERFFMLVESITIVKTNIDEKLITKAKRAIVEKDAAILADSKKSKAHFLLTLDTKHFFVSSAQNFVKPQKIVTPKMLIEILERA